MAQIYRDPSRMFGSELGTAIGTGLGRLAQQKLADIEERNLATSKFGNIVGDEQTARWINSLRPQDQMAALQWLGAASGPQGQQISQNLQPVQRNIQELATEQQPAYSPAEQSAFLQQLGGLPNRSQFNPQQPQQPLPQNLVQQRNLADQLKQQQEQQALAQRAQLQQAQQQQMAQQQQQLQQQAPQKPTLRAALASGGRAGGFAGAPQNVKLTKAQEGYVKGYETSQEAIRILDEMEELWNTGKVANGDEWQGFAPYSFQNEESQRFADLAAQLAGMEAQQLGIPTNAKLKYAESLKPTLNKKKNVQLEGIKRFRRQAEEKLNIARHRLPEGYFGEEELPRRQESQVREGPRQAEKQQTREQEPEPVRELKKQSPDTLNWFARKALEEAEAGAPKDEGWFDWFTRNINRQTQGSAPEEEIGRMMKEREKDLNPEQRAAAKKIESWWNKNKDFYDKPHNFGEKVFDKTMQSLPFIGLMGTKGAANIGKEIVQDVGSSAASTVAENLGFGKVGQLIASIGGAAGTRKLLNRGIGKVAKDFLETSKNVSKESYEKARELGKDINIEGRDYKRYMTEVRNDLAETSAIRKFEDKEELLRKFNQWIGDVEHNKINGTKLLNRKQEINSLFKTAKEGEEPFLARAKELMLKQLDKVPNKEFDSAWKRGDYLHGALKYPETFKQYMEGNKETGKWLKNPISYVLASGGLNLIKGKSLESVLTGGAIGLGVGLPVTAAYKGLSSAVKNNWPKIRLMTQFLLKEDPKIRNLTLDVMRNVIEDNKGAAQRAMVRLNKATEPYSELI